MKGIRSLIVFILLLLAAGFAIGGEYITLQKIQGDVSIRPGVTETWIKAKSGDLLKADATVRTGQESSALILLSPTNKRISLPADVIVDISDIRDLTQEELMLKLTMEKVRASSYEWKNKEMNIPNTTIKHGDVKDKKESLTESNTGLGVLQLNGTRVLYLNGFYSTSALKTLEILRQYPSLGIQYKNRLLVAEALEKANLKSEAMNEYVIISALPSIKKDEKEFVQSRIAQLKKQ